MDKDKFIATVYPEAKKSGEISPYFTTAQAALESGWGQSAIGHNLFGITTGSHWTGRKQLVLTHEYFTTPNVKFIAPERTVSVQRMGNGKYRYTVYRYFRDYDTLAECLRDHQQLLRRPQFADAWPYRQHPIAYTQHIVDSVGGKYATDPNYLRTMTQIIQTVEETVKRLGL